MLFLSIFSILTATHIAAQNSGNLTVGQSFTATLNDSPWLSPSSDFAFGFHPLPTNTSLFLLAIWYAKIFDTIVWCANDGNPVQQGSRLVLTAKAGLVLTDPQGASLWNTSHDLTDATTINHGFLSDTGNFVLKTTRHDDPVWQSFDHPTDTLLPGQSLNISGFVNSRLSETVFSNGRFQLHLIAKRGIVLSARDVASGNLYGAYFVVEFDGQKLIYNESGYMYIATKNGTIYDLLPQNKTLLAKDFYQRAVLNFDGVLIWYSIPKKSVSNDWSMVKVLPENICTSIGDSGVQYGSGICGFNSICVLDGDKRPTCKCPPGYSLLDPDNMYGSCIPDFKTECEGYEDLCTRGAYRLEPLNNTNWPFSDYEKLEPYDEKNCKLSCMYDCFCAAVVFRETSTPVCWKKKAPLSYGKQDVIVKETTWIKVGNASFSNDPLHPFVEFPEKHKNKMKFLVGVSVFVNLVLLTVAGSGLFFICCKKKPLKASDRDQKRNLREFSNVHFFTYDELTEATNGFTEELGRGAFGIVYKGMIALEGSLIDIAVKKLDRMLSVDADKEFKTEVSGIGRTYHKNLVRLVGFCKEEDHRLLVYEYMSNGTLADYLFGDSRPSWVERVQIALGIARGLLYLHEQCSTQIIHCDIKPQNILLDDNLYAKISDFGLAKLLVLNQTHTNTAIRGTKGYVAPEWFRNKPVTLKVDVYSFGVLLLEIICCRKNVCIELIEEECPILTDWAFDCYQSNTLDSLVRGDIEALDDWQRLKRFLMVALWCIQEDPSLRPTMRTVLQMLEGLVIVPKPSCPTMLSNM